MVKEQSISEQEPTAPAPGSAPAPGIAPGASAAKAPALSVRDLKFRYGRGRRGGFTLHIPRLDLQPGEQVLLTGSSGSGKSTLLHVVSGLLDPASGDVLIAGKKMHERRGAARDRFRGAHIGMIFQDLNLLHGFTALQNVMAALMFTSIPRSQHRKRGLRLLKELGIEHPHRDPARLSLGQQQRVAVARAMVGEPELVLADEPTASLDPDNAAIAMQMIQQTCHERGAALLCVSHDPLMPERFAMRVSLEELARGVHPRPMKNEGERDPGRSMEFSTPPGWRPVRKVEAQEESACKDEVGALSPTPPAHFDEGDGDAARTLDQLAQDDRDNDLELTLEDVDEHDDRDDAHRARRDPGLGPAPGEEH